jgi:hypothetical protein
MKSKQQMSDGNVLFHFQLMLTFDLCCVRGVEQNCDLDWTIRSGQSVERLALGGSGTARHRILDLHATSYIMFHV